jgi:hypothetical protein
MTIRSHPASSGGGGIGKGGEGKEEAERRASGFKRRASLVRGTEYSFTFGPREGTFGVLLEVDVSCYYDHSN